MNQDNIVLKYTAEAQEKIRQKWMEVERRKSPDAVFRQSGPGVFISHQESDISNLPLAYYYGNIEPGIYRLSVLFGFGNDENENRIQSNIITFKIQAPLKK